MSRLITMAGESDIEICDYLGLDYNDCDYIRSNLSKSECAYLTKKYPEYMGALPVIIGAIVSGAVKIGQAIGGAIKKKKAEKQAKSEQEKYEKEQLELQQALLVAEEKKKEENMKLMLFAGIPVLLAIILLSRR